MNATTHIALAACAFAPAATGRVQLLPAGEFRARDGRPADAPAWRVDAAIAAALIADIAARQSDIVVDYEHQSMLAADNGQPAPAAGWFDAVEWVEGEGVFAQVHWTPAALKAIEDGEYRYLSPVIAYDKTTGAVKKIINAALTNNPAIDGMDEVVARLTLQLNQTEALTMDMDELLERIRYLLNLPTLASKEEVATELQKAVDAIMGDAGETEAVAANSLGVVGLTQSRATAIATLTLERDTATAALKAAQDEVAALKAEQVAKEVEGLIEAALTAHKIAPAQKEAMTELGKTNLALLRSIIDTAVPVVAIGEAAAPADNSVAAASYDAPHGMAVDADGLALLAHAQAYQKNHPEASLTAALKAVQLNQGA